jgi:hypothetical protein
MTPSDPKRTFELATKGPAQIGNHIFYRTSSSHVRDG